MRLDNAKAASPPASLAPYPSDAPFLPDKARLPLLLQNNVPVTPSSRWARFLAIALGRIAYQRHEAPKSFLVLRRGFQKNKRTFLVGLKLFAQFSLHRE